MARILNANIDVTLGGDNASNEVISSQKATKTYVDNKSLGVISDTDGNVILGNSMGGGIIGADHALATNLDYASSGHTGFMKDDASNLTTDGQKVFDGQWVSSRLTLVSNETYPTTTNIEYTLSSYLPEDNYNYEVIASCATRASAGEKQMRIELISDIIDHSFILGDCISSSSKQSFGSGTVSIPVGIGRKITTVKLSWVNGTYSVWLTGYRRIGTNQ